MPKILRILDVAGLGDATLDRHVGLYVAGFDPEAFGGRGYVATTPRRDRALVFADAGKALDFYGQVPKCHPIRSTDGKPNRPMTVFTIEILDA